MGGFKIITADERLNETHIKGVIFGPAKIGKTSLLWTLDPESTLFVDLEAGGLSVRGWGGDSIEVQDWPHARDLACYLCGPNPVYRPDQPYSQAHYQDVVGRFGDPAQLAKYKTIFIDSITVAGRLCFQWAEGQPESFNKQGEKNTLGTYGLHGKEMVRWLTHIQHIKSAHVWLVGLLDEKEDEFKRRIFVPQIDGSKAALELPGIMDQVISMVALQPEGDNPPYRAFVCQNPNPWGYPGGDRSGKLDLIEKPHLGELMKKILGPAAPIQDSLSYNMNPNNAQGEEQ